MYLHSQKKNYKETDFFGVMSDLLVYTNSSVTKKAVKMCF